MTDRSPPTSTDRPARRLHRRQLLSLGSGAALLALAGCSGTTDGGGGGGYGGGGGTDAGDGTDGTFRLLISDQPVAIDEFDSLDVSLQRARIFSAGGDDADDDPDGDTPEPDTETGDAEDGTETQPTTAPETTTASTTEDPDDVGGGQEGDDGETDDREDDAGDRGYETLDLGGEPVDLTEVVGERAISVFEGGLPAGEYAKVELGISAVEGVVDGEAVDVKLPSEKLQITKPFAVAAGGTLSFVFDITVVRKGNGGYNLLPVVGESGVVGRDVDVEEVGPDGEDDDDGQDGVTGTSTGTPDGGPPEDAGGPPTETGV